MQLPREPNSCDDLFNRKQDMALTFIHACEKQQFIESNNDKDLCKKISEDYVRRGEISEDYGRRGEIPC